ncbi:transporter substrate-binding domain-containing protein [Phytoactinopolyspora mesophila]|uniref:Transporter substrate-binding domain-containing protein n=1 Tax=Phytoactinopolyspora mesophila TaxID=2650750 RepID=A0A7K3M9S7_9ACTN|nr:transporter substrate-binding domain-containing protein [Phytoactinopolyspora mesophila]NDL60016.1 transporter substrate-binding domain-containing protein [Phytoactinopolyspora mesophila]
MTLLHISRSIAVAAAGVLLLSACGDDGDDASAEANGDFNLVQDGVLTVCSDVPYPPFEFEDSDAPSGYSGFDMDLMQEIADNLGLEMSVQAVGFDPLQSGTVFAANQCDVGASAMTITEERQENIDFSDPYYDSLQSLLTSVDSGISSIEDLDGRNVGVQQGTTGQSFAEENLPEGASPQAFPSDGELWPALQAGNIDAILQDFPVNYEHEQDDEGYAIVETYETDEQYGFAFGKDDRPELLAAVNEQLAELREDGTYDEIYAEYFEVD